MAESGIPLTRDAALQRLDAFVPDAAGAYARLRNKDLGPGGHVHVSQLSAALRRRLISEDEVVDAVLARHGLSAAEKFISEVFWRTYWKGWLEQRPSVWTEFRDVLSGLKVSLEASSTQSDRYAMAVQGRTGIDCFDAWTMELDETGYLHNWARMQYASIWIFTLDLPWELGADHMFNRLIDADPASNTLSWRWVAGLHTVGKAYLADPERIRAMTEGRYSPTGLARTARIPSDSLSVPAPAPVRQVTPADPSAATLLLLTTEDLSMEQVAAVRALPVQAIAVLAAESAWDEAALADGLERASEVWPQAARLGHLLPDDLISASRSAGCNQIATAFQPVGPAASSLASLRSHIVREGLVLAEHVRQWDRLSWPHCRKGFFALKEMIPQILHTRRS